MLTQTLFIMGPLFIKEKNKIVARAKKLKYYDGLNFNGQYDIFVDEQTTMNEKCNFLGVKN